MSNDLALCVEIEAAKPTVGEVQVYLLAQLPLKADSIAVAHHQHPDHELGIDRRSANVAVERRELLTQISQNPRHCRIDLTQQMVCRNAFFHVEQIKQLALIAVLPAHHDPPPSLTESDLESRVARNHEPFSTASTHLGHLPAKMVQRKLTIASHFAGRKFLF
jgi:hypothetical protein